jgi:sulfate-transporting ATPase
VITHDRYFLDRVATHILAFEGNAQVYYCFGSYETYVERKKERDAEAGTIDPSLKFKHRKIAQTP